MRIKKEDIQTRFDIYNQQYFNGVLPKCKYHVLRYNDGPDGFYNPLLKDGKLIGHIWIQHKVDWTEEDLREVIVHEMIHHYVQTIEGHKGGLFGHNWRFRRQCRRIKKEYGLIIAIHKRVCRIGETKPTTLAQKVRRFFGIK